MVARKGMMVGKGSGYKNVIGKDPMVHSQSAKGIKQPQTKQLWSRYDMKTKQKLTKDLKLKDTDKDGVADMFDCKPYDKKHQDDMEVKEIGDIEKDIDYKIQNPKKAKFKEDVVKAEKSIVNYTKNKYKSIKENYKKKQFEKKTREVKDVRPEEVKSLEQQRKRVDELKIQINNATDTDKIDKLSDELDKEQDELRETQEKITEINLQDYTDEELKTLAIKFMPSTGFFDFFGNESDNKYLTELFRRKEKRMEIERQEKELNVKNDIKKELLDEKLKMERQRTKAEFKEQAEPKGLFDGFF